VNAEIHTQPVAANVSDNPWREIIYQRFRGLPAPLLCFSDCIIPAASIWSGTRVWLNCLRELGLQPGDRIACAVPAGPAFIMVLLASLWEGYTLALLPPGAVDEKTLSNLDARLLIADYADAGLRPDGDNLPVPHPRFATLRPVKSPPTPDIQLLARSSGTSGEGKWVALHTTSLFSVVRSHGPRLALTGARVLSVLPWHHLFGLVIELLPALFAGSEIIRAEKGGRDPEEVIALGRTHEITHFYAVPLTITRLLSTPGGSEFIRSLKGGIVGGAPINHDLAKALSGTRLRVGYGQTEAGPGIGLGEPGVFFAGCLGQPLGCETRIAADGVLEFRGPNSCLGIWEGGCIIRQIPGAWQRTNDIVENTPAGLRFLGRIDDRFKLGNGRMVSPAAIECALRSQAPAGSEFWVFTRDGETVSVRHGGTQSSYELTEEYLRQSLGALFPVLRDVQTRPQSYFSHTPKGELNRRSMWAALSSEETCFRMAS